MSQICLIKSEGGKSFVGIKYKENRLEFYYPETFRWNGAIKDNYPLNAPDEKVVQGIRMILSSIELAGKRSNEKTEQHDASDAEESFAMKSYLWIMQDFFKNGSYKNRESVFKTNQKGKINWKRTMAKLPMCSDGSFIYKDFVVSTKNQTYNLLVEIYSFCVRKSIYLMGWLHGIRSSSMGAKRPEDVELPLGVKKRYRHAICQEIERTFDDEKRQRLNHMLNIVNGLNKTKKGELVCGVSGYDHVFEAAVNSVFGTVDNLSEYNPHGKWSDSTIAEDSIKDNTLRLDALLKNGSTYIVIDAKCYRYADVGYVSNKGAGLPAVDSIQKQITYGDSVRTKATLMGETPEIYNCFLIPYNKSQNYGPHKATETFLQDTGLFATADWRSGSYEYEKVYAFFVDLRDLLEKLWERDHSEDQQALIEAIKTATAKHSAQGSAVV